MHQPGGPVHQCLERQHASKRFLFQSNPDANHCFNEHRVFVHESKISERSPSLHIAPCPNRHLSSYCGCRSVKTKDWLILPRMVYPSLTTSTRLQSPSPCCSCSKSMPRIRPNASLFPDHASPRLGRRLVGLSPPLVAASGRVQHCMPCTAAICDPDQSIIWTETNWDWSVNEKNPQIQSDFSPGRGKHALTRRDWSATITRLIPKDSVSPPQV